MSTLFISHSSSDNAAAAELSRRLAEPPRNHHSVFLDLDPEQGIVAGQSWEQTLYRKLRSCRAVIALCTDSYLGSQWCFAEIALARMEGKHIFALLVDPLSEGAKLPGILTEKQFIDLRRNPEEGYQRLWKGLEELELLGVAGEWDPRESPYLGLRAYQEKHAPVFFGRGGETRTGIELLDRGAPGLIMVLGSSGSGKSSLVRAGMVPRLRRDTDRWLVVDPFRPRRDPVAELAGSLAAAYRRYAPDMAAREGSRDRIREKLQAGLTRAPRADAEAALDGDSGQADSSSGADERLRHLLSQLEELRQSPPEGVGPPVMQFLDWSLDDLRRICGVQPAAPAVAARGSSSLVEIADHLRRASERHCARVLLIVDQFEELLGHDETDDGHRRFLELLRHSVEVEQSPLMVLGTMRSDFLGVFQRNRTLRDVDFESLSVGPMSVDAMRSIIEEPAKLGAIELEPGLSDRLLEDTETPDALPLLSFTLWRLWEDRKEGELSVAQYEQLGGLHGAIAREAETVLASARKQGHEDDVRAAFLQMARITEDGSYARQPASWDREELQKVKSTLEAFEQRRLLVTRQDEGESATLEVAHEALFRSWPPLKSWLDENRAELMLKQQIRHDAQTWDQNDRPADSVWRGPRLQQAADLMAKGELGARDAATVEAAFVGEGLKRRLVGRWIKFGIAALFFLTLGAGLYFTNEEKKKALAALARANMKDASRLIDSGRRREALTYLAEASRLDPVGSGADGRITDLLLRLARQGPITPLVHDNEVNVVAFSPDGRRVATASWDHTARIWDAHTGDPLTHPLEHTDEVNSVAFDPKGRPRVLTASSDGTARVWDADTGDPLAEPMRHEARVWSAAFSPDGRKIVTASWDKTARVWDAETGAPISPPLKHAKWVISAAFDLGGERVVTASGDVFGSGEHVAQVWNATTGAPIGKPLKHRDWVRSAAFSPDGLRVVTASYDATARVWNADTGDPVVGPLKHGDGVRHAAFSPDGKRVVTASRDHTARVWDAATGDLITGPLQHGQEVYTAAFSPDGRRIVSASGDHTARVWDATTGDPITAPLEHGGWVRDAAFSPDGRRVVTASKDHTARIWHAGAGEPLGEPHGHLDEVNSAAFSPDGRRIVTASKDGTARVWDATRGEPVTEPLEHADWVWSAFFSPDGRHVVTASRDNTARVWDAATGDPVTDPLTLGDRPPDSRTGDAAAEPPEHGDWIWFAAFSSDGRRLVTVSWGNTARLWDAATGELVAKPLEHADEVRSAAFSLDGRRVVTASRDKTARVWDAETGDPVTGPLSHAGYVNSAAFSPDGRRVVTADRENIAQVWDAATGVPIGKPLKHVLWVRTALFSPDGRRVVTASFDKTARVWDAATGDALTEPLEHGDQVWTALFSPDGRRVVTASGDGTARVWDATTGDPLSEPLVHGSAVYSAAFSPDGRRVVTASRDHTARVWDVQMGTRRDAALLRDLAEAAGGYELSATGVPTPVDDQKGRLRALAELSGNAPPGGVGADSFIRWFLADSWKKTVSPLSEVTAEEWIRRRLVAGDRRAVELAFPGHPLIN